MRGFRFLRLALTLLLAAGLVVGGASFGASTAAPMPVDCPHHAGMTMGSAGEAGNDHHDKDSNKQGSCHCPLMTCSGWTLAPVALDMLPFDPTALPRLAVAAAAFIPHPPGVPLQPPRA